MDTSPTTSISPLKARVTGRVKFARCADQALWYVTNDGWEFPVPLSDTTGATFPAEEKAIFFMRWIRKHIELEAGLRAELLQSQSDASALD